MPTQVGIVSSGLITHGSHASNHLLNISYDCVILDEAHRARRKNLGSNMDGQAAQANRLLAFMQSIAPRARSLLLATATPVQLRPIEAWDLLDVLARDDQSVLGNDFSVWRRPWNSIPVIMRQKEPPDEIDEKWDWIRNPMPPKSEHKDFEVLRGKLDVPDSDAVVPGSAFDKLRAPDRARVEDLFPRFIHGHNPYIRRIVRRTREQLENQIDPETNEPLLQRVNVELLGEGDEDAIRLPPYLREAYKLAEEFCEKLGERVKSAGFLRTGLLRRVGSTIYAGMQTAARMLETWDLIDVADGIEDDDDAEYLTKLMVNEMTDREMSKTLTPKSTASFDASLSLSRRILSLIRNIRSFGIAYSSVAGCAMAVSSLASIVTL